MTPVPRWPSFSRRGGSRWKRALLAVLPPEGDDPKGLARGDALQHARRRKTDPPGPLPSRRRGLRRGGDPLPRGPSSRRPRQRWSSSTPTPSSTTTFLAWTTTTLRRGKPTCHVVFGEATALLAGDTLQTLGFEVLSTPPAGRRVGGAACRGRSPWSARAIGLEGMAGGQALDLAATDARGLADPASLLRRIHALKTGRLLRVSVELGALYAGADAAVRSPPRPVRRAARPSLPDRRRHPRRDAGVVDAREDGREGRRAAQADLSEPLRARGREEGAGARARATL